MKGPGPPQARPRQRGAELMHVPRSDDSPHAVPEALHYRTPRPRQRIHTFIGIALWLFIAIIIATVIAIAWMKWHDPNFWDIQQPPAEPVE